MVTMPISDYPAPADERSQIQVRQERKGELTEKAQQASDRRTDPQTRQRTLDAIRSEMDANSRAITRLQFQKEAREKNLAECRAAQARTQRARLDTKA